MKPGSWLKTTAETCCRHPPPGLLLPAASSLSHDLWLSWTTRTPAAGDLPRAETAPQLALHDVWTVPFYSPLNRTRIGATFGLFGSF